jgi:hypothetical protein
MQNKDFYDSAEGQFDDIQLADQIRNQEEPP